MRKFTTVLLVIGPCLVMSLINIAVQDKLPDRIPIHWNILGQADNWGPKASIWLLPGLFLFVGFLCQALSVRPPGSEPDPNRPAMNMFIMGLGVLFTSLHIKAMTASLDLTWQTKPWEFIGLALFMMFLGRGFTLSKKNHLIGLRLPSTLRSDENWDKTHRFAGRNLFTSGLFLLALIPIWTPLPLALATLIINLLLAAIYSLRLPSDRHQRSSVE